MINTYRQAREYLETLIKPFQMQRIEGIHQKYQNPFGRMSYLLDLLGNPQKKFPSVVVSGTSGKTSTSHYIASLLTSAGYRVGLTISPHLQKLNERMQINNQQISDDALLELVQEVRIAVEKMEKSPFGEPSYFEVLLSCAFLYFAKQKVDIVVAEVGLEGKYDGTNILDRLVFVYTNTSLDHTQILGETVEAIAQETISGIIPNHAFPGAPFVISGVTQPTVKKILEDAVSSAGVSLALLGRDFSYTREKTAPHEIIFSFFDPEISFDHVRLTMDGEYQAENAALALEAVQNLKGFGFIVSEEHIRAAFAHAHVPGRFEVFGDIILDGAHNPAKMEAFLGALAERYPDKKKIFVIGFKEGKDTVTMLDLLLPVASNTVVTTMFHTAVDQSKNASLPAEHLYQTVLQHQKRKPQTEVVKTHTVQEALSVAKKVQASIPESIIVVTGSLYVVGEARDLLTASL